MKRRLARASFGPEWRPFGHMASWLLGNKPTQRDRDRLMAYLREARRELQ